MAGGDGTLNEVIQAAGRYLAPGLADMHVHVTSKSTFRDAPLYLANGVTTVLNLKGDSTHLAWVSCVPFALVSAAFADALRNRRWHTWVAALTVLVLLEKTGPGGVLVGRVAGVAA